MKRILSLLSLVLVAVCAFAASVPALAPNEAFVIVNNLPLYVEKSGTLEWKESLVIGDRVVMLNKSAKFKLEGKERDYVRVRSALGNDGWVRSPYVVPKSMIAVVYVPKAVVYTAPRDVNMTTKFISNMTLVAVLQDGSTADFAKVVAYDETQDLYFTDPVFISKTDLTYAEVDLRAFILFTTAKTTKDKALRQNFFKTIEAKYPTSIFFAQIKAVLSPEAVVKASAPFAATLVINDDNVNVRAAPDEINGQVVAQLSRGATVEVLEATTQSYTIGSLTGPWYKIKSPEGWVFGPFLSAKN